MLSGYRTRIRLGAAATCCWAIGVRNAYVPACPRVTDTEKYASKEQQRHPHDAQNWCHRLGDSINR